MQFTVDVWREQVAQSVQDLKFWLDRWRRKDAPYLVYGTLSGLTLWPLVEAAAAASQSGQPLPASLLIALGSVAGGVGGNLVAEQVQRWVDRAEGVDEDVVAGWIARHVADNDELRAALDAILEEMDAVRQAQAALPAGDRAWFVEQLRAELSRLENLGRFEAALAGGGAIAQGPGATAVGERGVNVGGDTGDVLTGDGAVKAEQYIERYYAAGEGEGDDRTLLDAYLGRLLLSSKTLSLAGIDPKAAGDESEARLRLDAVYTALLTTGVEQEGVGRGLAAEPGPAGKARPVSALAQLNRRQHLVLLGDPGSGKTTFVNFVALCMAGACLGRDDANLETLTAPLPDEEGADREGRQPWDHGPLLPLRVVLRDLAARGLPPPDETATAGHLWAFLEKELKTDGVVPLLRQELHRRGGLLLLDGLDEVPEAEARRAQIRQLVEDVAATLPQTRILVTSRTYAYQKQAWRLSGFDEAVLAPFTSGQIRRFVDHWYAHVAEVRGIHADDAQGRAELLKAAVFASERLRGLAERPLLLTLMASLHAWRGGSLPEKREELYADAVDLLLDWWESQRVVRDAEGSVKLMQPSLAEWLRVDREKVRDLLNRLAYEAHAAQPDLVGTADVPEEALVDGLLRLSRNPDVRPHRLVEYLSHRAGLLVPRGVGVYTFPHRTFQEYLAACHLANLERLDTLTALAREEPDRWREVVLLAAAKSERGFTSSVWFFVDSLCGATREEAGDSLFALWGAHLAAQAVVETADLESLNEAKQRKVARLQQWLVPIVRGDRLPAVERVTAAANLAHLGDPRPAVLDVDAMPFCYVPSGPFWMDSDAVPQVEHESWQPIFGSEKPCHEVDLPYDYWLGRYPVTNAHFAAFVEDGGYQNPDYWPEAASEGLWREEGEVRAYTWIPEKRDSEQSWCPRPHDYGRPFNLPNHPVVGVAWYEALAFARWLTACWRAAGALPAGWAVRLPSEAEWEKAARGGVDLPAQPLIATMAARPAVAAVARRPNPRPRRLFPWGDEADDLEERANCEATGVGSPGGAGCFPAGRSPYGCEEMAGNVWEWTRTLWGRGPEPEHRYPYVAEDGRERLRADVNVARVLRGSSYGFDENWLRCAARLGDNPYGRFNGYGFRVVVSPVASDL